MFYVFALQFLGERVVLGSYSFNLNRHFTNFFLKLSILCFLKFHCVLQRCDSMLCLQVEVSQLFGVLFLLLLHFSFVFGLFHLLELLTILLKLLTTCFVTKSLAARFLRTRRCTSGLGSLFHLDQVLKVIKTSFTLSFRYNRDCFSLWSFSDLGFSSVQPHYRFLLSSYCFICSLYRASSLDCAQCASCSSFWRSHASVWRQQSFCRKNNT